MNTVSDTKVATAEVVRSEEEEMAGSRRRVVTSMPRGGIPIANTTSLTIMVDARHHDLFSMIRHQSSVSNAVLPCGTIFGETADGKQSCDSLTFGFLTRLDEAVREQPFVIVKMPRKSTLLIPSQKQRRKIGDIATPRVDMFFFSPWGPFSRWTGPLVNYVYFTSTARDQVDKKKKHAHNKSVVLQLPTCGEPFTKSVLGYLFVLEVEGVDQLGRLLTLWSEWCHKMPREFTGNCARIGARVPPCTIVSRKKRTLLRRSLAETRTASDNKWFVQFSGIWCFMNPTADRKEEAVAAVGASRDATQDTLKSTLVGGMFCPEAYICEQYAPILYCGKIVQRHIEKYTVRDSYDFFNEANGWTRTKSLRLLHSWFSDSIDEVLAATAHGVDGAHRRQRSLIDVMCIGGTIETPGTKMRVAILEKS